MKIACTGKGAAMHLLSILLAFILTASLVFGIMPASALAEVPSSTSYIGFTSDVHSRTDYLQQWLTSLKTGTASLDRFIFGGDFDYTVSNVASTAATCVSEINTMYSGTPIYTAKGNHDQDAGSTFPSIGTTAMTSTNIGYNKGLVYSGTDYAVYVMDSTMSPAYVQSFSQTDINALPGVLDGIDSAIPVFVICHFPIHYLSSSRVTTYAEDLFNVLNEHSNVVFLWGHNHSQNDPEYGKVKTAGDTIQFTSSATDTGVLNFTYANLGCMYSGNNGAYGLLTTIDHDSDSSEVTFEYKNLSGNNVYQDGDTQPVSVTITPSTVIGTVGISVTAPAAGEAPAVSAAASGSAFTGLSYTPSWDPNDATFGYNTAYTVTLDIPVPAGYSYASEVTATVNGAAAQAALNGTTLTVTYTFASTGAVPGSKIYRETDELTAGENYIVVANDGSADYAVTFQSDPSVPQFEVGATAVTIEDGDGYFENTTSLAGTSIIASAANTLLWAYDSSNHFSYVSDSDYYLYGGKVNPTTGESGNYTLELYSITTARECYYSTDFKMYAKGSSDYYFTISSGAFNVTSTAADGGTIRLFEQIDANTGGGSAVQTITYDANGGSGATMASTTGIEGASVTLNANSYIRSGHTFLGWNTDKDASAALYTDKQAVTMPAGGLELYAIWAVGWDGVTIDVDFSGSGTTADPYEISSAEELAGLAGLVNGSTSTSWNSKYYVQTADIDLNDKNWTQIGIYPPNSAKPFSGTYDGDGYVVTNLYINLSFVGDSNNSKAYGLFGYVTGTIKNLGVIDPQVSVTNTSTSSNINLSAGGLVGAQGGGGIYNSYVTGGTISATVSADDGRACAGGLVAYITSSSSIVVENCYAAVTASVASTTGSYHSNSGAGGLTGYNNGGASVYTTSYWDTTLIPTGVATGTTAGPLGKTAAEMKAPEFVALLNAGSTDYRSWMADATPSFNGGYPLHLRDLKLDQVTGIEIKTQPKNLSYTAGENFDPTGMVVTVTYSDSTTADITTGYTYSPTGALTTSDNLITVSYGGKSTTLKITVIRAMTYRLASTITDGGEYVLVFTNSTATPKTVALNTTAASQGAYAGLSYTTPNISEDKNTLSFSSASAAAAATWTFAVAGTNQWTISNGGLYITNAAAKVMYLASSSSPTAWTFGKIDDTKGIQLYITISSSAYNMYYRNDSTANFIYPSQGGSNTFAIYEKVNLDSIEVTGAIASYVSGQSFDTTGMTVTAHYSDGTSAVVTGYSFDPSGPLTSDTTVTISYTEYGVTKTDTVDVTVTGVALKSIEAVFTQDAAKVYTSTSLDSLKPMLAVTGTNNDGSTFTVASADYTLSGTLTVGSSTITVTYGGKTDTFSVTVTAITLQSIKAVFTQDAAKVYTSTSLDSLKPMLAVTGTNNDGSTFTVASADYTLSGTLTVGSSTITVTYSGKTDTFSVTVTAITLQSIKAVFTQDAAKVYTSTSLDSLKPMLAVTGTNGDGSTFTVAAADYTLSGTLTVGSSTITVTYGGKTDTFSVTVTAITLQSIEAVFTQGAAKVYTSTSLDSLKPMLAVTGTNNDGSTFTVAAADYTLSGTLTVGSSTITVTYGGKTDTFSVTVTAITLQSIEAVFTQGAAKVYTSTSLDSLKPMLAVTGTNNDGSTFTVAAADYTLSGTLTVGSSTITVTCGGKTDTFSVTVTAITLQSIEAVFTQGAAKVYTSTSLDSLKPMLAVTGTNNDGSTFTVAAADYTLSGTLTVGSSTITVTYGGKTDTFIVTVTSETLLSIDAVFTQGGVQIFASTSLNSLKSMLVVTGTNNDGSAFTVAAADYTLSGTLTVGISTVLVTYGSKTDTFIVTVTDVALESIDAIFTQGNTKVYTGTSLNNLKPMLLVTGINNDGSIYTIDDAHYDLSGILTPGTSTILVVCSGKTDTFKVTVTDGVGYAGGTYFDDVSEDAWYYDAVQYVVQNGLFRGVSDTLFKPDTVMSRGMLITVLYRLEGMPAILADNPYRDVAFGKWYTDAVVWATRIGIITGYDNNRFGPSDPVTREQLVTILYRYSQFKGYDLSAGGYVNIFSYADADTVSQYAVPAVQWATGAGIMLGDGFSLSPQDQATRAQLAVMLLRFIEYFVY